VRMLVLSDYWGELGGGEVVAAELARGLSTQFELAILTTDREREFVERRDGLPVYRVRSSYPVRLRPLIALANPLVLASIGRVLDDFRPDVVHAWNVHQHLSYASLRLAHCRGLPTVLTFQDAQPFCYTKYHCYIDRAAPCPVRPDYRARPQSCPSCWRHYWLFPPRNRAVRELIRRYVGRKVAVSHALAQALTDNGLGGAQVIHNGLALDAFPPETSRIDSISHRFGLEQEVVVGGGRMGFFKGQHLLVAAFAQVMPERPGAQLALAGNHEGPYGRQLEQQARQLGVSDRIVFTGFLPRHEFLALVAAGALFANLSICLDCFPTVNLEAGAAARAVLGTCFGGTPEAVLDGETGRVVNPHRAGEVAQALRDLLANAAEREEMGRRAAERVRSLFSVCAMVEAYATLFRSLK
jgi:glycosyltransferase involved in cell wall biosynthesis